MQALDGIRILDLSDGIAGPLGVLFLAEHGADVIKVEPPGGSPSRAWEGSRVWNRSRRSIVVDLQTDDGRARFLDLVADADAVVESFRPGVLSGRGVGWDVLTQRNPRVILVSCSGYPEGHRMASRPGYDALVQASSGVMWEQPGWRFGPVFLHMPMPSMGACYLVATGLLAALAAREQTGRGQHVRTSLYQGALLYTTQVWQAAPRIPASAHDMMAKTYPPGIHQPMLFECAGGEWLHVSVQSGLTPLKSMDEVVGLEPGPAQTADQRRRERFLTWDRDALIGELRACNHAVDPVTPAGDVFHHPQTIANGMVATVVDPDVGPTTQMGVPIHLAATPGDITGPQPRPGEHDALIAPVPATTRRPPPTPPPGTALDNLRVLDFGQYLAGPFGPMILGDLGADVVKIEPVTGDAMRAAIKPFLGCQRGKRSLALDLKNPMGLDVARRLMAGADVVHHNMTRGVATRLGIDYAAARAARPDVIYCNTYAYGLPDPLGHSGGLDPLYQASAGLEYEAGAAHTGQAPLYLRFGMCDASNAMLSVVGVLIALVHRRRTGEGQELWTSLHDGGIVFSSDVWLDAAGRPWDRPHLDAGLHGTGATYRLYRTLDEGWICVAAVTDEEFESLCAAIGNPALAGAPEFESAARRRANRDELEAVLTEAFATRTAGSWTRALDSAGVPNEIPVDTLEGRTVLADADNVRLGLVTAYEHPEFGRLQQFGTLIDFSETPGRIAGPAPTIGQHSREVLREAGYLDGDIDAMADAGVIKVG